MDVLIRRTVDLSTLAALDEGRAGSEDGIALNLSYADMRGWTLKDARLIFYQEHDLLSQLAEASWRTDAASAILDEQMSEGSELTWFDPGIAAAVFALSAAGATPISSCNGGTIGGDRHSSETPNILVAAAPKM